MSIILDFVILTGVRGREDSVDDLGAVGQSRKVGNEHIWKLVELGIVAGSTADFDGSAVHVVLGATAGRWHPSPCKGLLSVGNAVRQREGELIRLVETRAGTLNSLDDLEGSTSIRLLTKCNRKLAQSAVVHCAAFEAELLRLSYSHLVLLRNLEAIARLARKSGGSDGRVVDGVRTIRNRTVQNDVGIGDADDGSDCEENVAESHVKWKRSCRTTTR